MKLSQIQLEAFQEVARHSSFTKAALQLNLTQSALSHRIRNLEMDLETSLFVRSGNGVRLTERGAGLLQFCRVQTQAEEEFLQGLRPEKNARESLAGTLRIGGVSSLMRATIIPAISELVRKHPNIRIEISIREASELPRLISSAQVDFVVIDSRINAANLEEISLGKEEYVLIESSKKNTVSDVYLDNNGEDQTTFEFFKLNGKKNLSLKRSFMGDIYGILDGVSEGFGRAVVPLHLISEKKDYHILEGFKNLYHPVYLYQVRQPYYTKLHLAATNAIQTRVPAILACR